MGLIAYGALFDTIHLPSSGQINAVGIKIFSDVACTVPFTSFDFHVNQGGSDSVTAYLKNVKNNDVSLSMSTSNWVGSPANASATVYLGWNAPSTLAVGQVAPITFTLTAVANTGSLDTFVFETTITGTQI